MDNKYDIYRNSLLEAMKNENFIIDGNELIINGININDISNLDFTKENIDDELVCVHVTDYFPYNNEIICTALGKGKNSALEFQPRHIKQIGDSHRHTVHTTLNFEVSSHTFGNWDGKDFIILQPFNKINSKLCGFATYDTYFEDRITLTEDSVILVRESARKKYDFSNISGKVISFKGNPEIAVEKAMIIMGYKPQKKTTDANYPCFSNEKNMMKFCEMIMNLNRPSGAHYETLYSGIEHIGLIKDTILSNSRGKTHEEIIDNNKVLINEINFNDIDCITYNELMEMYKKSDLEYLGEKYGMMAFFIEYGIDLSSDKEIKLYKDKEIINNWLKLTKGYLGKSVFIDERAIKEGKYDLDSINKLETFYNNFKIIEHRLEEELKKIAKQSALEKRLIELTDDERVLLDSDENYLKFKKETKEYLATKDIFITFDKDCITLANMDENFALFCEDDFFDQFYKVFESLDWLKIYYDPSKNMVDNINITTQKIQNVLEIIDSKKNVSR